MSLTKENAIKILNSRKQVSELGVEHTVKVSSVSAVQTREDGTEYRIINLAAYTPYHKNKAIEHLKSGDFDKAANQGLTSNARVNTDFIPVKGQFVNIVLDEFATKDGEVATGVSAMYPLAKAKSESFDFAMLAVEAEVVEAEIA